MAEPVKLEPITSRLLLLRGVALPALTARARAYQELYPGSDERVELGLGPMIGGWLPVVLPLDLSPWHLHNLVKWIEAGDEDHPPVEDFLLLSRGSPPWAYWLGRPENDPTGEFLAGSTFDARPLQVHVPSGRPIDKLHRRVSAMGPTLAMMTRAIPLSMQQEDYLPEPETRIPLSLQAGARVDWVLPEPANLADGIAPLPDERAPDALTRASNAFWSLFKRG